jgi:hypothetical protein
MLKPTKEMRGHISWLPLLVVSQPMSSFFEAMNIVDKDIIAELKIFPLAHRRYNI